MLTEPLFTPAGCGCPPETLSRAVTSVAFPTRDVISSSDATPED
jgi:hypothetical protein